MEIKDCKIGMEVYSCGNKECTYFIKKINSDGMVAVEFNKDSLGWSRLACKGKVTQKYKVYPEQIYPANRKEDGKNTNRRWRKIPMTDVRLFFRHRATTINNLSEEDFQTSDLLRVEIKS